MKPQGEGDSSSYKSQRVKLLLLYPVWIPQALWLQSTPLKGPWEALMGPLSYGSATNKFWDRSSRKPARDLVPACKKPASPNHQ